jgi:colanic acid biosynthesis glycosyl transferase WcaI
MSWTRGHARPAKIVFVNRYFSPDESATSRMLSELAFGLAEHGLRVYVVASRQLYEDSRAGLAPRESIKGVTVHRVSSASQGRSRLAGRALDYATFHASAAVELLRLLSPGDVVVAKTDPPLISIAASKAAAWRGAVLINWLQDLFPEVVSVLSPNSMPPWLENTLLAARDGSLRAAAMNVVLSDGMGERLASRGIGSKQLQVIPNWANSAQIVPLAAQASLTRRRVALDGCFVVGYSGNLGRAHEFETLLGAARLLRSDPDIAFLITGAGAKAAGLRQAVESEGLTNFVFQDYQPADMLGDSLAAADIHLVSLLPALEGLIVPSKVYGILAAGRPALFIGDTHGEVGKLVRTHECGIAVPVGASEPLATHLRKLKDAPERLAAMGKRARTLAMSRYTGKHAVHDWLRLLDRVAPQVTAPMRSNQSESLLLPPNAGSWPQSASAVRGSSNPGDG